METKPVENVNTVTPIVLPVLMEEKTIVYHVT